MSETRNSDQPGAGSTRTVAPASGAADQAGPTKRVLLVDDHDLFREVLGVVLERHAGFGESVHAGSLAEARRALDERRDGRGSCWFDLAIVDLDLPGGDGLDLLAELREAAPGVPVIGVTANLEQGLRARALEAGASEVLATTVSGKEITATARRLGG